MKQSQEKPPVDSHHCDKDIYYHAFENTSIGMCIVDLKGNFVKVNPSLANMLGYSQENLVQMNMRDVTHPDYIAFSEEQMNLLIAEKRRNISFEKKYLHQSGHVVYCSLFSSVVNDNDGKPVNIISNIQDITVQKKAETDLLENENTVLSVCCDISGIKATEDALIEQIKLNRAIFDNFPCMALLQNSVTNKIIASNSGAKFGQTKDVSCHKLWWNKEKKCTWCLASEACETGMPRRLEVEHEGKFWDTHWIPTSDNLFLHYAFDVTDRKKVETDLVNARQKAEESDRLKSAFIANVSHEIRTPMNGIIGFSQILNKPDITDEKRKHFIDIINDSCHQLLAIINDILDISRIETGQVVVCKAHVNVNDVLLEMLSFFRPIAHKSNVTLFCKKELSDEFAVLQTDRIRLNQILMNLISNAIKFTHDGTIEFGYRIINGAIEFYVKDTGIGIPKELLGVVFDRFRQVESHLSRNYSGAGLGLSICKGLVELLGGKIWVESEVNSEGNGLPTAAGKTSGSVFYFTIPLETDVNKTTQISNGLTILIAEDEITNYFFLEEILLDKNYKILHAKNGKEAVDLCNKHPEISLVLMDIKMPELDGFEATELIKKTRPLLPIIAQTAYALQEDVQKIRNAGFTDYIAKPMEPEKLLQIVSDAIKNDLLRISFGSKF